MAALIVNGSGWVYFPKRVRGVLGTAIVWADRNDVSSLNVIVDDDGAVLAAIADGFVDAPIVWQTEDTHIHRVDVDTLAMPETPAPNPFVDVMRDAGLDVVSDHGVWIGEINGLEVARVGMVEGEPMIDLGVGAYDQFASAALDPGRNPAEALERIISMVAPHRLAGSEPHPMGRLVRARWLRAQAVRQPQLVGLDVLHPVPLLEPRPGLQEDQPAAALGSADKSEVLVVFSVGVDLGVSETAAGLISLHQPERAIVAMPSRDHHDRIRSSLNQLRVPTELVAIEGEWAD